MNRAIKAIFRRVSRVVHVFSIALPIALVHTAASSQDYPSKPIRLIVPYAAGTVTDIVARRLSDRASAIIKQAIVVDNRPGASATIGTQIVAQSKADGYTLLFGSNQTHSSNSVVLKNQGYDPIKDFTPIARLVINQQVLAVSPALKIKSVAELVAFGKDKKNAMSFVSAGKGTVAHIAGEQFKSVAGLDMVHTPYNNSQLMVDLVAGRTSMIIYPYIALKPFLANGQLVSLATLGNERPAWMRDVPTMAESGYSSMVFISWFAIFGPANLPSEVVTKVSDAFRRVLTDPSIAAGLIADGSDPAYADGAELGRFTVSEIARLHSVVKNANLTFDN